MPDADHPFAARPGFPSAMFHREGGSLGWRYVIETCNGTGEDVEVVDHEDDH